MIGKQYFDWMFKIVDGRGYTRLLESLHREEFYSIMPLDENRIVDGRELRYRFATEESIPFEEMDRILDPDSCSILEMMVGLAIRIEETIMEDADFGNRTSMWFWIMIKSMGLYGMRDESFSSMHVITTIDNFLNRGYSSDGSGGLFTVKDTNKDMRDVDIWYQMCMFFDKLL